MNMNSVSMNHESSSFTSLQTLISIIVLGYFGIKIVYSTFFGYYPDKFYEKSLEITKEKESTIVSSYTPGLWNNEFTDFMTLLVLSFVIYLFTNFYQKSIIQHDGVMSGSFLMGYIIGLGYPIFKKLYDSKRDESFTTYVSGIMLGICALIAIIANYTGEDSVTSTRDVSIYLVTLTLLLYGLYLTRKKSSSELQTRVLHTKGDKCVSSTTGIIQSSGEKFHFSTPFFALIVLLLFKRDPSSPPFRSAVYFIIGLLLGIFVSAVSYFGFEYFLEKTPEKVCDNVEECDLKKIDYRGKSTYEFVKEYIQKAIQGSKEEKNTMVLKEATEILDKAYSNKVNQLQQKDSVKKSLFNFGFFKGEEKGSEKTFRQKVKIAMYTIILLLLAYLLFISIYRSFHL